jgi:hypothetical protein
LLTPKGCAACVRRYYIVVVQYAARLNNENLKKGHMHSPRDTLHSIALIQPGVLVIIIIIIIIITIIIIIMSVRRGVRRYYIVVVQYAARLNNEKLKKAIRQLRPPGQQLSRNSLNFRLASQEVRPGLLLMNAKAPFLPPRRQGSVCRSDGGVGAMNSGVGTSSSRGREEGGTPMGRYTWPDRRYVCVGCLAARQDNARLTGFVHNAVSPFGLAAPIPVSPSGPLSQGQYHPSVHCACRAPSPCPI